MVSISMSEKHRFEPILGPKTYGSQFWGFWGFLGQTNKDFLIKILP